MVSSSVRTSYVHCKATHLYQRWPRRKIDRRHMSASSLLCKLEANLCFFRMHLANVASGMEKDLFPGVRVGGWVCTQPFLPAPSPTPCNVCSHALDRKAGGSLEGLTVAKLFKSGSREIGRLQPEVLAWHVHNLVVVSWTYLRTCDTQHGDRHASFCRILHSSTSQLLLSIGAATHLESIGTPDQHPSSGSRHHVPTAHHPTDPVGIQRCEDGSTSRTTSQRTRCTRRFSYAGPIRKASATLSCFRGICTRNQLNARQHSLDASLQAYKHKRRRTDG